MMQKKMPKLGIVLLATIIATWMGGVVPPAFPQKAPVEVTGQTECFDASGVSIDCDGTGQDGEFQAGVPWPTPRFKDNKDGTVTDNLTKLIWLRDARCDDLGPTGTGTWLQALQAANTLASGRCGLSDDSVAGDWRLPNVKELQSLIDFEFLAPALSNAAGTGQWAEGDAFSGVERAFYWTSTTVVDVPGHAWILDFFDGMTHFVEKNFFAIIIWPVRGGK
jgi:hypothetical protein